MSVNRTRLHVSRRSRFPRRCEWEAREEVKEDSPVLGGEVLVLGGRRGQDVETGDERGTMTLGGQRS